LLAVVLAGQPGGRVHRASGLAHAVVQEWPSSLKDYHRVLALDPRTGAAAAPVLVSTGTEELRAGVADLNQALKEAPHAICLVLARQPADACASNPRWRSTISREPSPRPGQRECALQRGLAYATGSNASGREDLESACKRDWAARPLAPLPWSAGARQS